MNLALLYGAVTIETMGGAWFIRLLPCPVVGILRGEWS